MFHLKSGRIMLAAAAASLSALSAPTPALARTLPAVLFSGSASAQGGTDREVGVQINNANPSRNISDCSANPAGCFTSSAQVSGFGPVAEVNVFGGGSVYAGGGTAIVDYELQVVDASNNPVNGLIVPLVIEGIVSAAVSGAPAANDTFANLQNNAIAQISYGDGVSTSRIFKVTASYQGPVLGNSQPATGNLLDGFSINSSGLGYVEILAGCNTRFVNLLGSLDTTCVANADPMISIDSAFLATHPGLGLALSAGVTQALAVPEPSVSWLFGLGLAGLGIARRRIGDHRRA